MIEPLRRLGRFVLEERIATGGMAEIHRARAPDFAGPVVLKTIRRDRLHDPDLPRLFALEAALVRDLDHPSIVRVLATERDGDLPFLVLEYLDGLDLMRLIRRVQRGAMGFSPATTLDIAIPIADALAYAHGRPDPIIHRDVTPHNIMVTRSGAVKLLDFGIAQPERHGAPGPIRGKVAYMSPEQARGEEVDTRTDVYALGVVMFELLSGRLLFRHPDRMTALSMVRRHAVPQLRNVAPTVPMALASVVDRAVARRRGDRYVDARHLRDALLEIHRHCETRPDSGRLSRIVTSYPADEPDRPPDPQASDRETGDAPRLHGRDRELATLEDDLRRARSEATPRIVLLHGRRGIGKTALLQRFAALATARGATVRWSGQHTGGSTPPEIVFVPNWDPAEHGSAADFATATPPPRLVVGVLRCPAPRKLAAHAQMRRIDPLDPEARRALLEERFEDPQLAGELVRAMLDRCGGNPGLLLAMAKHLLEVGVLVDGPAGWRVVGRPRIPLEIPSPFEQWISREWNDLTEATRNVAGPAAIWGRHVPGSRLRAMLGPDMPPAHLREMLHALRDRGLLREAGDDWSFADASTPEVFRLQLDASQRTQLHRRAAEILADDASDPAVRTAMAEHLVRAGLPEQAITPALRAAAHARSRSGHAEAYYHLTQALAAMPPDDPRRFEALAERESILRRGERRREQARDLRTMAAVASDADEHAQAWLQRLRFYIESSRVSAAERLWAVPSAMALRPRWSAARAELGGRLAAALGELDVAEQRLLAGLAACATIPDGPRWHIRLLRRLAEVHMLRGAFEMADACLEEALHRARRAGTRPLEANLLDRRAALAMMQHRYEAAIHGLVEALRLDRELQNRHASGAKLGRLGWAYAQLGATARAEATLRRAIEIQSTAAAPSELAQLHYHLGDLLLRRGSIDDGRRILHEVVRAARRMGDDGLALRAELAQSSVEPDPPPAFAAIIRAARQRGDAELLCLGLDALAQARHRAGDDAEALMLAGEAVAWVRRGFATWESPGILARWGALQTARGEQALGERLRNEARELVQQRIAAIRDPNLQAAYRSLPDVMRCLPQ